MENTLVLIKPDAVEQNLIGRILMKYEEQGLVVEDLHKRQVDRALLDQHYRDHVNRDFYPELAEFMSSGPVVAVRLKGINAIEKVRKINGATNPKESAPGSIRYMFGSDIQMNCVHGSESKMEAERELTLWF
ncbi:MAG: nucleoside-diphosphate kinase [Clostridiales bacterium]|nr:nucleoside-diphosphate kinase [Clostridiales bacterium]